MGRTRSTRSNFSKPETTVPLVGAAQQASGQFPSMLEKQVVVRGKHYPDRQMIAVGSIEAAGTAADAPAEPASKPLP